MTPSDDIPALALDWHRAGRGAVLATVVETWGSAPRPVGSQLVIDGQGVMQGSVSGGCVEGAVVTAAIESVADQEPRLLEFGVSDDTAFAAGLACGGQIKVLVTPVGQGVQADLLAKVVAARAERRALAVVTDLQTNHQRLAAPPEFPERFRLDQSGIEEDGKTFVAIHNPPLRLIVVGAVHIAQPLVSIARLAGHAPILIDPRPAFGSEQRFPGEQVVEDWPEDAMATIGLDARTAVVTLTHESRLDDPAIRAALGSNVFYIGSLGSTRTHAKRVARLIEAGHSDADIARIHAPVGLDLGGKSAPEIAISIMAEITRVLRKG